MQESLSRHGSWKLDRNDEDIRGWMLQNQEGSKLGTVGELLFDTDTHHVTEVVLENGNHYEAREVMIGDHVLWLKNGHRRANVAAAPIAKAAPIAAVAAVAPVAAAVRAAPAVSAQMARPAVATRADVVARGPAVATADDDLIVPIIEEQLEVGKRNVAAGNLRVTSRVVAEPFSEELRLRDERVSVDRRRIERPLDTTEANNLLRDQTFEMKATSEQSVVEKRSRLVEEVSLKKSADENVEHVRDVLRYTQVEVTEIPTEATTGKRPVAMEQRATATPRATMNNDVIPIVKEELRVGKREIETGGVRVTTHVATRPIDREVTVRKEHIEVERHPLDRSAELTDDAFRDRTIEMTATSELPFATKRARVVEEIHIHKDRGSHVESIRDSVRHTEVNVVDLAREQSSVYADHFKRFGQTGQRFEVFAPAYGYGEQLAIRSQGSTWGELEPRARSAWETENPGTWDRFKDAIRFAWERKRVS